MNLCWDEENRLSATRDQYYATANIYDASGNRAWKLGGEVNWMWNNGQGWQAYGDFNLRSWYQSDRALRLRSATDLTENAPVVERGRNQRGVQFNPFKSTQHCSRTNLIQYTPVVERSRNQRGVLEFSAVSQNLKGRPVAPLSGDVTELGTTMTERLRRDFECLGIDYNAFYPGDVRLEALETLLNAPEQADEYQVFFYHSDHLGSSSFITDINGDATQHLQYLPFGEDLVHEQNTAAYLSPYTFSGKERDVETSLSYFGARYYEAGLSLWLSVDPMAERYPNLSPFQYCRNNPILRVDPNGLTDYEFDKKSGKLILIEGTENSGPDRVIKNAKYDENGNLKNKRGVLQLEGKVEDYHDGFGDDNEGRFQFQTYTFSNESDANNAYKFMANSTNVEIGKWKLETSDGNKHTRFFTSGHKDRIRGEYLYMILLTEKQPGLKLLEHQHNHGNLGGGALGTYGPSGKDEDFARRVP